MSLNVLLSTCYRKTRSKNGFSTPSTHPLPCGPLFLYFLYILYFLYLLTSSLPPPVSSQSPYTAAKPPAPQSTHPPADNSPPPRSTSAPPPARTHSAYAQNRFSRRPWA